MNIVEYFKSFALLGAEWVMWVLIALSMISVTIIFERAIFFWGKRSDVATLIDEILALLKKKDIKGALKRLGNDKSTASVVAIAALNEADNGVEAVEEAAASARIRARLTLEKNLAFLGTVGNNAPFVGLFGTVIGIIQAFHELSENSAGGVSAVMSGISEALVATAMGLLVAIPAVAAFNIFQRRTKALLSDSDAITHSILASLQGRISKHKE